MMPNERTSSTSFAAATKLEMARISASHCMPLPQMYQQDFLGPTTASLIKKQVSVCRSVARLCEERLFYFEFTRFVNGALQVHLEKWNSGGARLLMHVSVVAFSPQNASVLVRSSQQPYYNFLDARFEELVPCRAWYSLKASDTRVVGMCVFFAVRGCSTCMCPVAMRHRYERRVEVCVLRMRNALGFGIIWGRCCRPCLW